MVIPRARGIFPLFPGFGHARARACPSSPDRAQCGLRAKDPVAIQSFIFSRARARARGARETQEPMTLLRSKSAEVLLTQARGLLLSPGLPAGTPGQPRAGQGGAASGCTGWCTQGCTGWWVYPGVPGGIYHPGRPGGLCAERRAPESPPRSPARRDGHERGYGMVTGLRLRS